MFARVHTLFLFFVFALCASAASVSVRNKGAPSDQCDANSGTQQCCDSITKSSDPVVKQLAELLGIVLGPLDVGLTCSPIVGTTECDTQAACCTGDTFSGLITIGCSPINIVL